MKFYDRKSEMGVLETLYRGAPSFVVLTGRRRVGKTEIIKQFFKGKRAVYLYADNNKSDGILLSEFEAQIKAALGIEDYVKFGTY
ncbi:MAG: ATP-binding protein, partial [Candidatus Dadabacteria bacterium]|nr:ATP-binding protein [Candidatus Dadabacteria bacterium]